MAQAANVVNEDEELVRRALGQFLQTDLYTSQLDRTLDYRISPDLRNELDELKRLLAQFTQDSDYSQEVTSLQLIANRYRIFISRILNEFLSTNDDINRLSSEQLIFMHEVTILGGKLQSYNQLLATAANHQDIYLRLREAAILNEIDNKDALEYLRRNRDGKDNFTAHSKVSETATTTKTFDNLVGVDPIVTQLRSIIRNIRIGLVDSFQFIIFYGIPGTGKTALSESLASEFSDGEYFKFDQAFMASPYIGGTETRIRSIFERIRANPNKNFTIVIDEADNVLAQTPSREYLNSIKILLQTEISSYDSFGTNLLVVCITNYLSRIDQTFKRRATSIVLVPEPSAENRVAFLESQLTPQKLKIDGRDVNIRFSPAYRQKLFNFNANMIYTNSDMGRLAKNVQDNFLVNFVPPSAEYLVYIHLLVDAQLILFYSATDDSSRPQNININTQPTIGPANYLDAMNTLYAILESQKIKLSQFKKYFAPDINILANAVARSSTLSLEAAQIYLQQ